MIDAILTLGVLPFALAAFYLGGLGVLAPFGRRRARSSVDGPYRFLVVVPAHNEESMLPDLLNSLREASAGKHEVTVAVIADHCTDATAAIARGGGAQVFERTSGPRSKGAAIRWLLSQPQFAATPRDAVVLIDADCVVNSTFFSALAARLAAGSAVVQAYYDVRGSDVSASLQLRQIAFALVHLVRPLGRAVYGASAGLWGTGMCFRSDVLERMGWQSDGLAEDAEEHLRLLRAGYRVDFARDARVSGFMARSLAASGEQHRRWEAGRLHALRQAPGLLVDAIRQRNVALLDGALEQLVPPLSVLVGALALLLIASMLVGAGVAAVVAASAVVALGIYVLAGIVLLRPAPRSLMAAAIAAPAYVAWKLLTYGRALLTRRSQPWVRTTRDQA